MENEKPKKTKKARRPSLGGCKSTTALTSAAPTHPAMDGPAVCQIAPQALDAVNQVRSNMALIGVGSLDTARLLVGLVIVGFRESNISLEKTCTKLCPIMFEAFSECGAPKRASGSLGAANSANGWSEQDILNHARHLQLVLLVKTVHMGFERHMWPFCALWILAAMCASLVGVKEARKCLPEILNL